MDSRRAEGTTDGNLFSRLIFLFAKRMLGRVPRPMRIHALQPPILRGYAHFEQGQRKASAVPARLKKLAQVRAATLIGCPF